MTSQTAASTLFIDLATFTELEGFMYGGPNAITWFVASIQKSNWFSFIPISLRHTGTADFGQKNISAAVNRSGDYVLGCWFRAQIPIIYLKYNAANRVNGTLRWVRNLMHNLMEKIQILFNELVVQEFDNYWLDNNYVFRIPGSKKVGYRNIIGDIAAMTVPVGPNVALGTGGFFSCIMPFWFGEDSGLALPVAALPFNDTKINYIFRRWQELVMVYPGTGAGAAYTIADVSTSTSTITAPTLVDPQTWAHYAVVHNDERVKMGDAPRDMLIHQVQEVQLAAFKDVTTRNTFDLRLSHAIVCYFFEAENISLWQTNGGAQGREMSNYTTVSECTDAPNVAADPIANSILVYENTVRVSFGSDYYSLIVPYYFSDAMPDSPLETGMHMYTYALHPWDPTKPSASTNYSKLANVSISYDMTTACQNAANTAAPVDAIGNPINLGGAVFPQKWRHAFTCKNLNIARVANGSLGHPTL